MAVPDGWAAGPRERVHRTRPTGPFARRPNSRNVAVARSAERSRNTAADLADTGRLDGTPRISAGPRQTGIIPRRVEEGFAAVAAGQEDELVQAVARLPGVAGVRLPPTPADDTPRRSWPRAAPLS
jgi:hypothetical protein